MATACCRVSGERHWSERTANDIAHQGLFQVKGAVEAVGFQHVADAAIEALDHAVGLGRLRRRQAVLDAQFGAQFGAELVKLIGAGWGARAWGKQPVGELFSPRHCPRTDGGQWLDCAETASLRSPTRCARS